MEEKIIVELEKFEETTKQASIRILNELKKDCSKYGELEKKLIILEKNINFKKIDAEKYSSLFNAIHLELEKEKSDLQITNHKTCEKGQ